MAVSETFLEPVELMSRRMGAMTFFRIRSEAGKCVHNAVAFESRSGQTDHDCCRDRIVV